MIRDSSKISIELHPRRFANRRVGRETAMSLSDMESGDENAAGGGGARNNRRRADLRYVSRLTCHQK